MKTPTGIAIALAVAVSLVFLFFGPSVLNLFSFNTEPMTQTSDQTPGTLGVSDTTVGTGAEAKVGDTVQVNYVGMLEDGTVFDASANHGGPYTFVLGAGTVIAGWDQGIVGMKEGGQRTLIIPPELGYGPNGYGPIPPNATILFQVELVKVGQ